MYTCKDAVELLLDFVEGDLPDDIHQHLIEHLEGCSPCVDFVRMYQATPGLCRRAVAERMPTEMADKLTDFLREKLKK